MLSLWILLVVKWKCRLSILPLQDLPSLPAAQVGRWLESEHQGHLKVRSTANSWWLSSPVATDMSGLRASVGVWMVPLYCTTDGDCQAECVTE